MTIHLHRPSLVAYLLLTLQWGGCSHAQLQQPPIPGFRPIDATFNFGDSSGFERRIENIASDGANRLLIVYTKVDRQYEKPLGNFFRVSSDGGSSFGPERKSTGDVRLIEGGLAAVSGTAAAGGANLFYLRSSDEGATWTLPAQINDEEGSMRAGWGGGVSFVQPSDDDVYCLWTDRRRGFISLFYSSSSDGGRRWSPNQAVEYDFREGEQSAPKLLMGADRRLIAIWIDWRDRQTLADIRSSYSDDSGQHWSASQKVNDDSEHVWQVEPSAVAKDNKVFVAFRDFRDGGEEGDNDWNIYLARSDDNAASWAKNVRVNDIQPGEDASPKLAVADDGTLCCAWRSGRTSIFGDVAVSRSADSGRTWSGSTILSEGRELMIREPASVVTLSGSRFLCLLRENGFDLSKTHLEWLEPFEGETAPVASTEDLNPRTRDSVNAPTHGDVVFSDDFSDGDVQRWRVESGVWTVVDGAFMGVEPASQSAFSSYARMEEPDRYIVSGRFKLDPVAHHIAHLYFRWDGGNKFYQIINQFRFGLWMGMREGDPPASGSQLTSLPLVQRRFPFQNNRWYEFVLAVAPERIDYFIDGRLMLSYTEQLRLPRGRFGIGGAGRAPTYFDDIVISKPAAR